MAAGFGEAVLTGAVLAAGVAVFCTGAAEFGAGLIGGLGGNGLGGKLLAGVLGV